MKKIDYVEERKAFDLYRKLPLILFILSMLSFLIGGIIDATNVVESYNATTYGIMMLNSAGLCVFVWILIGIIPSAIASFLALLYVSYKVLVIANLEKISGIEQQFPQMIQQYEKELSTMFSKDEETSN